MKKILLITLVAMLLTPNFTKVKAAADPIFGIEFIDFAIDNMDPGNMGARGTTPLGDGATLEPGRTFQVDLTLSVNDFLTMAGIQFLVYFDPDVVEPIYWADMKDYGFVFAPMEIKDNDFFPKNAFTQQPFWDQSNPQVYENNINIIYSTQTTNYLKNDPEKRAISLFFRVKEDAEPGSEIKITYTKEGELPSKFSGSDAISHIISGNYLGHVSYAYVFGEPEAVGNPIEDLQINGTADGTTYDYLQGTFNSEEETYNFIVPNAVNKLTFVPTLNESVDPADFEIVHGRVDGEGISDGDTDLVVGTNYFKTVVRTVADGQEVAEYLYTVKRLSSSTTLLVSATDNMNNVNLNLEDLNHIHVASNAQFVDISASLFDDKDSGITFEYAIESEDASVDQQRIDVKGRSDVDFTITVIPEDALEIYQDVLGNAGRFGYSVTNNYTLLKLSDDVSIQSLLVSDLDSDLTWSFDESQDSYLISVDNEVKRIKLEVEPNHPLASVEGVTINLNDVDLVTGLNNLKVKVKAEDPLFEKTYDVNVTRAYSDVATLDALKVTIKKDDVIVEVKEYSGAEIVDVFHVGPYDFSLDYTLDIEATPNAAHAATIKSGNITNKKLSEGENKNILDVVVQAEDGITTKTYQVNAYIKLNSASKIDEFISEMNPDHLVDPEAPILDQSIVGEQDGDVDLYRHTIHVKYFKKRFQVGMSSGNTGNSDVNMERPYGSEIQVVNPSSGDNAIDLVVGENTFIFENTSQDGSSVSRYIFTIIRAENDEVRIKQPLVSYTNGGGRFIQQEGTKYYYEADATVDEISILIEGDDDSTINDGANGTFSFPLDGSNEYLHDFSATSQDGSHTENYQVIITRQASSDTDLSALHVAYQGVDAYDYLAMISNPLIVETDVDSITIQPSTNHPKASFTINGGNESDFDLNYDNNNFVIVVKAEDDSEHTYNLIVNRKRNHDADLSDIYYGFDTNLSALEGFDSGTTLYHLSDVSEHTDTLNLKPLLSDDKASFSVIYKGSTLSLVDDVAQIALAYGSNAVDIKVVAHDGSEKSYTIHVNRDLSSSTLVELDDLNPIKPGHSVEEDPSLEHNFIVYVPYGTKTYGKDDFNLNLMEGSMVEYPDGESIDLDDEGGIFSFKVIAPNGVAEAIYTIKVIVKESTIPLIDQVKVNDHDVSTWDPDNYNQIILLDDILSGEYETLNIDLGVKAHVSLTSDAGLSNISVQGLGEIVRQVTLTDTNNGEVNVYNLTFKRSKSNNKNLESITLSHGALDRDFDPYDTGPYEVHVDPEINSITIHGMAESSFASVHGDGERDLLPGKNIVTISVTPEDGSPSKDYNIVIMRALALVELKLGDIDIDVNEKTSVGNVDTYNVAEIIDASTIEAYVKAVANDPSVSLSGQVNKDVVLDNSVIEFTMTASDGESQRIININYQRTLSDDAHLQSLKFKDQELLVTGQYDYTIEVDHDFDQLNRDRDLKWVLSHPNASVSGAETMAISHNGENRYVLKVKAEDGSEQTYHLTFERKVYNFLESLSIGDGKGYLEQSFNPTTYHYDALIYARESDFSFEWTLLDGVSVLNESALKNINTSDLPQTYVIQVRDDNKIEDHIREYTIHVVSGLSTRLLSLEPSIGTIDFKPEVLSYHVYVEDSVTSVSLINVIAEDDEATLSGHYTDVSLTQTTTILKVIVSNGGLESEYEVSFTKVSDQTQIEKITAQLGSNTWESTLSGDGFKIEVDLGVDLDDLNLDVILEVSGGQYTISDPEAQGDGSYHYTISVTDINGINKVYPLVITHGLSDNNFLESIHINGSALAGFNRHINEYEYSVNEAETLNVSAIAEDSHASVDVMIPDPMLDQSQVIINVTSAQGSVNTYTITITKQLNNNALLESLQLKEAALSPQFNEHESHYYVSVPHELDYVTVQAVVKDNGTYSLSSSATVSGDRIENLQVGENTIDIMVEAENGSSFTYKIFVSRALPASNFLDDLKVLDQQSQESYSLSPSFNSQTLAYTVSVPFDQDTFTITADYASDLDVFGLEDIVVSDYPYIHQVHVVDHQNVRRSYFITFVKQPSQDASLANLSTSVGALSPVFESDVTSYNVDVAYDVMELDILYTKKYEDQVVEGAGRKSLAPGRNSFVVQVSSGANSLSYTIHVNRALGTPTLDWLSVDHGSLSPSFNDNHFLYHVEVAHDVDTITLDGGSGNDVEVHGLGLKSLAEGLNSFSVVVDGGYGQSNTYYVVVNRLKDPSEDEHPNDDFYDTNLDLAYLDIRNEQLNESFQANVFSYSANLEKSFYETVPVIAIARNPNATVSINNYTNLGDGEHAIVVRVALSESRYQDTTILVTIENQSLQSDIHTIGDVYIATIKANQSVLDVKQQMLNDNEHLFIYNQGELLDDHELVPTGALIKLIVNQKEYDVKTLVVLGDVNGDGEITIADLMKTQSSILGATLSEIETLAADVSQDEAVAINDFMMIQSHILKLIDIHNQVEED